MNVRCLILIMVLLSLGGWLWLRPPDRSAPNPDQRRPQPAKAAAGRFQTAGDQLTVFDHSTGLRWQRAIAAPSVTLEAAAAYCNGNVVGLQGTGWRLPTEDELLTISDLQTSNPAMDTAIFPAGNEDFVWSSSKFGDGNYHWGLNFMIGFSSFTENSNTGAARCVR